MTFQDQANEFALRVLTGATDTVQKNLSSRNMFTMFGIAGTEEQAKAVLDYVCAEIPGRRVSDVSFILPKILITRVATGYDLLGTVCVGAIIFKEYVSTGIPKVSAAVTKTAVSWGLGEILIEENS